MRSSDVPTPTDAPPVAPPAAPGVTPLPVAASLHPECPDLARLGPNRPEAVAAGRPPPG